MGRGGAIGWGPLEVVASDRPGLTVGELFKIFEVERGSDEDAATGESFVLGGPFEEFRDSGLLAPGAVRSGPISHLEGLGAL